MFATSVMIGTADEFHTATATLVDLGHGPMAVTCAHVMADYLEPWKAGKALIRINNIPVSHSQLAGCDRDVDLATIRLSAEQAADVLTRGKIGAQFYQPTRWPPEPARQSESVALGGFPAEWRQERFATKEIVTPYYGIGATDVTSASDRQFGCRFEREYWIWMLRSPELPDPTMLGGLSGGPVFAARYPFADRFLHRELVGIVTDYWPDNDIMLLAHAHWIQEDGSIRTDRPWSASPR
jgi:hypothetical protein